jgi:hypothetical protein
MPEYFNISFILKKTKVQPKVLFQFLDKKYEISEGKKTSKYFGGRSIIVFKSISEKTDFIEVCVNIPNQLFFKNYFNEDEDVERITNLVNDCFLNFSEVQYALCSYEINAYLIGKVNSLNQINFNFLEKFPISYFKENEIIVRKINHKAQNIFKY